MANRLARRCKSRSQRGVIVIIFAIASLTFVALMALVVDGFTLVVARLQQRSIAQVVSITALYQLYIRRQTPDDAIAVAEDLGKQFRIFASPSGDAVADGELGTASSAGPGGSVVFGNWTPPIPPSTPGQFTPGARPFLPIPNPHPAAPPPYNAVAVELELASVSNLRFIFSAALGTPFAPARRVRVVAAIDPLWLSQRRNPALGLVEE